jgi:hypothetical protein
MPARAGASGNRCPCSGFRRVGMPARLDKAVRFAPPFFSRTPGQECAACDARGREVRNAHAASSRTRGGPIKFAGRAFDGVASRYTVVRLVMPHGARGGNVPQDATRIAPELRSNPRRYAGSACEANLQSPKRARPSRSRGTSTLQTTPIAGPPETRNSSA